MPNQPQLDQFSALQAMNRGEKITHRSFTPEEWMTLKDGQILTEDGVLRAQASFWRDRRGQEWDDGYQIFEPNAS